MSSLHFSLLEESSTESGASAMAPGAVDADISGARPRGQGPRHRALRGREGRHGGRLISYPQVAVSFAAAQVSRVCENVDMSQMQSAYLI